MRATQRRTWKKAAGPLAWAAAGAGAVAGYRLFRRSRYTFADRVVLVTGGSRGLGLVLARELVGQGARVAILARDAHELERAGAELQFRGGEVHLVSCDVRDRAAVARAVDEIVARLGRLDVLVNNAGVIQAGPLDHMTVDDYVEAMGTHFWGPLFCTLAALPHLRARGEGRIVNITSIGGRVAVPHMLPYSASKFALVGLSEGLRHELAREGILVTTVSPGLMRTGSHVRATFKGRHQAELTWFTLLMALPGFSTDARQAARRILDACREGRADLVFTAPARLAVFLQGAAPELLARIFGAMNRMLPRNSPEADAEVAIPGLELDAPPLPDVLRRPLDQASLRNNEVPELLEMEQELEAEPSLA